MTRHNQKQSHSDADTVVIGDKSFEALAAEFGDICDSAESNPPKNSASLEDLSKIWNCHINTAARKCKFLVGAGLMKSVGRFKISSSSMPREYFVRVRK